VTEHAADLVRARRVDELVVIRGYACEGRIRVNLGALSLKNQFKCRPNIWPKKYLMSLIVIAAKVAAELAELIRQNARYPKPIGSQAGSDHIRSCVSEIRERPESPFRRHLGEPPCRQCLYWVPVRSCWGSARDQLRILAVTFFEIAYFQAIS